MTKPTAMHGTSAGRHPVWWADVMQGLPDLVSVVDTDGHLAYVSPSCTRLLGRTPIELVGRRACEFIASEDRRNSAAWMGHATCSNSTPPLIHRLIHADGGQRPFETRLGTTQGGRSTGRVIAVSRDVSAQTAADEQIGSISELWHRVCEHVVEGVVMVTDTGVLLAANPAAARLFGTDRDLLIGSDIDELIRPHPEAAATATTRRRHKLSRNERLGVIAGSDPPVVVRIRELRPPEGADVLALVLEDIDGRPRPALVHPVTATVARTDPMLSPRERTVLLLLADGLDVRAIGNELGISVHTARHYVKTILRKLGAHTQVQAVVIGIRAGLIDLS